MLQTTLEGTAAAAAASAAAASSAATASHGQALLQKTFGKARIVLADGPEEFVGNSLKECIAAGDSVPTQGTSRLQQGTVVKKVVFDLDEDADADGPEEFVGKSPEECIAAGDSTPAALNARPATTQGTSRLQQGTVVKKVVLDLDEDSD
jgi:hypothetical protein